MSPEAWAAQAWASRAVTEHHAQRRFGRLARELGQIDPTSPVIAIFERAAQEEAVHAGLCEALARELGAPDVQVPEKTPRVAPAELTPRQALLYEIVAACCVAETESMATLTLLLSKMSRGRFRDAVHRIARDEVDHAQAGWAQLAREAARGEAQFLAGYLVPMLDVTPVRAIFSAAPAGADDDALYELGVVPHTKKREIFVEVLEGLFVPGLAAQRIDVTPVQTWLQTLR